MLLNLQTEVMHHHPKDQKPIFDWGLSRASPPALDIVRLNSVKENIIPLLKDPDYWELMFLHSKPLIVRLLLRKHCLPEFGDLRVSLHHFVDVSALHRFEIPGSNRFEEIPWHRHVWPSASYMVDGLIRSEGSFGNSSGPNKKRFRGCSKQRTWSISDKWNYWHTIRLVTPTASKIYITDRNRFAVPPVAAYRPPVSLYKNDLVKQRLLHHFDLLLENDGLHQPLFLPELFEKYSFSRRELCHAR